MFASCRTAGLGTTNCGSDAGDNCCSSEEVTSGSYARSYVNAGGGPASQADHASVSAFRLDTYLVTVGRFRRFVGAVLLPDGSLSWTPPPGSGKHTHLNGGQGLAAAPNVDAGQAYESGWAATDNGFIQLTNSQLGSCSPYSTWTNTAANRENLPINCVTWQEAYAFCIWDGGFLPSESEWEYAAAGGIEELEYPWGTAAPGATCPGTGCEYAIYNCQYPAGAGGSGGCTDVTNIAPVGTATLGEGRWGQLDLAGNLFEWTLDWYGSYVSPCADCAQLNSASSGSNPHRALRGASFDNTLPGLLPPYRYDDIPFNRSRGYGFRCARIP
jgi:formylglycine-generating enzyme required for sulfatase activity